MGLRLGSMCRRNWREAGVLVLGRPPVECRFIIAFMFLQIGTTCRSPLLVLVPEECPSQVCQLILGISYPSSTSSFPACLYGQGFSPRDQVTYHMLHRKLGLHCRPEHIPIHAARCTRSRSNAIDQRPETTTTTPVPCKVGITVLSATPGRMDQPKSHKT